MTPLHSLQTRFRDAVLGGDAEALLAGDVLADGLTVARRLDVYRNNTFILLTEALKASFPVVCRLVDERFFGYAAHTFIAASPPGHGRLYAYGEGFPSFLDGFEPARTLPYLGDVARLEWAMNEAYFAADALTLDPAALIAVPPAQIERLRLVAHPSVRLLASAYPIDAIWEANQTGRDGVVDLGQGGVNLVVQRPKLEVVYRALGPGAYAFLRALTAGATLAGAVEAAEATEPSFDVQGSLIDNLVAGTFSGFAATQPDGDER